jgi:hypothetical protein
MGIQEQCVSPRPRPAPPRPRPGPAPRCASASAPRPVFMRCGRADKLLENTFAHRFDILYNRFHVSKYWWVVITLVRRTVLVRSCPAAVAVPDG